MKKSKGLTIKIILLIIFLFAFLMHNVCFAEQRGQTPHTSLWETEGLSEEAHSSHGGGGRENVHPQQQEENQNKQSSKVTTSNLKPDELTESEYKEVFDMTTTIMTTITVIGIVVSIIMVMALGIKYMVGSIEERAEYKRTMIPMLVGAILIFASSTLVSIIYSLAQNLNNV